MVDRHVDGVVEMMLDATQNYRAPLTAQRLFGWHAALFPTGYSGMAKIAVADLALARAEASPQRFYSMSAQIQLERDGYYAVLEQTQKGTLDITLWLRWFLACLDSAFDGAENVLASVLRKARLWDSIAGAPINARQRKVINRLLDLLEGTTEGKLTTTKWAALTKTSADTALRDIGELVALGVLVKDEGGGRNTSYSLAPER